MNNSRKKNFFSIGHDLMIKKHDKLIGKPKKDDEKNNLLLANFFNIGYYLLTPLILGVFLGLFLDYRFKTKSIFTALFIFLGMLGSLYNLWKIVKENM